MVVLFFIPTVDPEDWPILIGGITDDGSGSKKPISNWHNRLFIIYETIRP